MMETEHFAGNHILSRAGVIYSSETLQDGRADISGACPDSFVYKSGVL